MAQPNKLLDLQPLSIDDEKRLKRKFMLDFNHEEERDYYRTAYIRFEIKLRSCPVQWSYRCLNVDNR